LLSEFPVDQVVFSYSDVSYEHVMHWASRINAAGASFRLLGSGMERKNRLVSPDRISIPRDGDRSQHPLPGGTRHLLPGG
jgi:hypothetical protein